MAKNPEDGLLRRIKGGMLKRVHGMLTCREFEDFVLRYLDGELTKKQARVFEWHMRLCRECREYLAAYERALELGQKVISRSDDKLPEDVPEDLVRAILDAREQ